MPRKIFLHIGAAKTGSSAIQSFIRRNRYFFAEKGFEIPDRMMQLGTKVTGEHVIALQEMLSDPDPSRLRAAFEALRDQPEAGKAILISAENLSNPGHHKQIADVLDGFDASVILYIRRQDDLLTSAWQQWHSKTENDFQGWLIRGLRQYGHWDRIIDNWEGVVGKGRVTVRLFERNEMIEGDLRRDFLQCLGLDAKTTEAEFEPELSNPSYSDVITSLVAGNTDIFKNAHDNAFYHMIGKMTGDYYVESQKVSLLNKAQRDSIVLYYREINKRVCENYFPGRAQLFSPVDHSRYQYLDAAEMLERQMKFLAHLVCKLVQEKDS